MPSPKTIELLRASGLRSTVTRCRVLDVLRRARKPLSHLDVMDRLADEPIDRVTVYRTLNRLTKAGVLHEAFVNDRTRLYETADRCHADHCHAHFACRACQETVCLTEARVDLAQGLPTGYVPTRQKVLIEGFCPSCSASRGRGM